MQTYIVHRIRTFTTSFRIDAESESDAEAVVREGNVEGSDYDNETEYVVKEEEE